MGIYIYSVRTTQAQLSTGEVAYALNYLSRSTPPSDNERDWMADECAYNRRLMAAAESTWERRGVEDLSGTLVYLPGKADKPQDGDTVIRYAHKLPHCYDCDSFGEHVGFLKSRKVGRKTVWDIVPTVWTVHRSVPGRRVWNADLTTTHFSAADALAAAKAVEPGCYASITANRTQGGKSALERVAEPTEEEARKVKTILLSGPWPVRMWAESELRPAAENLLLEGTIELYREESGSVDYILGGWMNMAEAAAEHLEAPRAAVDYDFSEDGKKIVCTVATVGRFEGWHCNDICGQIQRAGKAGRKFSLDLGVTLMASDPRLYTTVEGDRINFLGGKNGAHSLALSVSSTERLVAHWKGYCENNGATPVVS